MSEGSITSRKHNEYVGTDANAGRIPGASEATTGHHYIALFPKGALLVDWLDDVEDLLTTVI